MSLQLPESISDKVKNFPEYRMGANRVKLVLKNGAVINDVYIAWSTSIVKIGNKLVESSDQLNFEVDDIYEVIDDA